MSYTPHITHEFGSKFPESISSPVTYLDMTDEFYASHRDTLIGIYEDLNAGNYSAAAATIKNNNLQPYFLTSQVINRLDEEIRNTQLFAFTRKQQIYYSDTEPYGAQPGDIWISN